MKLTRLKLKELIKTVIKENQMALVEEISYLDEQAVFDALAGKDFGEERILTLGIMSGQNPDAIQMSPEENEQRRTALEADINAMGLDAIRVGGVFEGNREDSLLIINPHKVASETAGGGSPVALSKRDAAQVMDGLNQKYGQWGYVLGTKEPDDPVNQMRFEMMQMEKYPGNVYDDEPGAPDEDWEEFEDMHAGEDYMKGQTPSPESAAFGKKAPYSKTAKSVQNVPDEQEDFYSYVQDPKKKDKQGKKFGIPLYEVKVGKKLLRIKRRK